MLAYAGAEALIMPLAVLDDDARNRVFSCVYAALEAGCCAPLAVADANSRSAAQLLTCIV